MTDPKERFRAVAGDFGIGLPPVPPHPSHSGVQSEAEKATIKLLSVQLGVPLRHEKVMLREGVAVHIDGYHEGPPLILAEVFAHQGPLKSGQRHKLMSDALKLLAASRMLRLEGEATLMLVLTDERAAEDFKRGWRGAALDELGVEVRLVPLAPETAARVLAAQTTQRMVNES